MGDAELRVRHGGSGPAVLLLHGHPRTHVTWHKVAPVLAERFTVVCPDLRGYGESSKPPTTPDHAPYSKRAMAGDCAALMRGLGHEQFCVAGHDRGTYVAQRLAMDHPALVSRLCLMEGIPIAFEDYRRAIHDPATVHAMIEDYRAGLGIDRTHDDADRAADRRISCPLLFLWAAQDDMGDLYGDPLAIWRDWAEDVRGCSIDCGHHIAEEAPAALASHLTSFFAPSGDGRRE